MIKLKRSNLLRTLARIATPLLLLLMASTAAQANAPSQPGALRYDVYSSTAAEIFWDRSSDDGTVVGYEIQMNDDVLGTFDVLSYYSDSLVEGVEYRFTVSAIDNLGNRSAPANVQFIGGAKESIADGSDPASPANLNGEVYSKTAAEIYWDRPTTFGLSYEVSRNNETVAITDGISYYDDGLSAGNTYLYEVVAINRDGARSAGSEISLTTAGDTTPPITTDLMPPTGLVGSVYSSSALEIMWDRPSTFGLSYEISRNGVLLTNTTGVSYYDDELSGGETYTYEVVAIGSDAARSTPAIIMLNTSGGTTPTDTSTTHPDIAEPADLYQRDGYETVNVIRLDVRTETTPGVCTVDDDSGCTLADVIADIDGDDDFTVDIPIHFQGEDLPDDGSITNAELRQRGGFTRLAPQKSFRIKLDSKEELWRNERRLQLNKMPYDTSRIRNKMSFDLMSTIPHLPSLRTQFVNLWIDDGQGPEDYGLFTHTEYVGKEYLVNRERDTDDKSYKIEEFVFSLEDLEYMALDEDGEPLDDDRFESRLDIKSGDDHRKLLEMVAAVNDKTRTFESVLAQYFDENNVLAWVTVNALLHQQDAVTHNFYLYNPVGTDKFYFMPWDYDGTFVTEQPPANNFDHDELMRRLYFGYSKGRASNFLNQYLRIPGIHQKILAKAAELRNNQLMDSTISEMAARYASVVSPYAGKSPDFDNNTSYSESNSQDFANFVAQCHQALIDFGIPLPPKFRSPKFDDTGVLFRWEAAHDMNGNTITYDIEIASSPEFNSDDRILLLTDIPEESRSGYKVDFSQLGSGTRYARLVARVVTDPENFWQIASTRPVIDGVMRVGVQEFMVP